jgi:hypothetical protein
MVSRQSTYKFLMRQIRGLRRMSTLSQHTSVGWEERESRAADAIRNGVSCGTCPSSGGVLQAAQLPSQMGRLSLSPKSDMTHDQVVTGATSGNVPVEERTRKSGAASDDATCSHMTTTSSMASIGTALSIDAD